MLLPLEGRLGSADAVVVVATVREVETSRGGRVWRLGGKAGGKNGG